MHRTGWQTRVAGLVGLALSLSCGDGVGPRVPANIVIVPNQPVVPQGLTLALTATVVDAAGRAIGGKVITFVSADTLIATVSASGLVTSEGPLGSVRITATSGQLTAFVDVSVAQRIVSLAVLPDTLRLAPSGSALLSVSAGDANGDPVAVPGGLTFTSADPLIATVNGSGFVTSTGPVGSTSVTVAAGSLTVVVPIYVSQIPTSITISPPAIVLGAAADTQRVVPTLFDQAGQPIPGAAFIYVPSAPSVFSVSVTGLVTALGPNGSGTVTVSSGGVSDSIRVFVGPGLFGVLVARTPIAGAAYAAAVSAAGAFIISVPTTTIGVRGDLPSYDLGTIAGVADPLGVAINPAGTLGYFALRGTGSVAVLDLASNTLQTPLTGAAGEAFSVAVSADGQFVFVGATNQIYKFNAGSGALVDSAAFPLAIHLAVHPSQALLYASGGGGVAELDVATMAQTRTFPGYSQQQAVAVAPDGSELYLADEGARVVRAYNLTTGLAAASFTTSNGTFGLAVTSSLVVATESVNGLVEAFNRVSRTPAFTVTTTGVPRRPAFNAAGNVIVIPNEGGWVDFIR